MSDLYFTFSQQNNARIFNEAFIRHCLVRASHQFETGETRVPQSFFKRLSVFFRSKRNHQPKKPQQQFRRS